MLKKQSKNQKPTDIDVSFKYICPNLNCGFSYWLFLREVKEKNFKIVCECGTVFKPKRIQSIDIIYDIKDSFEKIIDEPPSSDKIDKVPDCVSIAINMMISLGYSKKDAKNSISHIYSIENILDSKVLLKKAISYIGEIK